MQELLVFSGTSEGRILADILCRHQRKVTVCVATEYGQEVMEETPGLKIHTGRLQQAQMEELIASRDWEAVVDATHPYAAEVTENIKKACSRQGRKVLRLIRPALPEIQQGAGIVYVDSLKEAAEYLNQNSGNIFFTTGSKELPEYLERIEQKQRIFVRILPGAEEVEKCHKLGLKGKQIICMQGPFSEELNYAMLKEVDAAFLVTKETAQPGGFPEKIKAAQRAGATAIIIKRPAETGYSIEGILKQLGISDKTAGLKPQKEQKKGQIILAGMGMGYDTMTKEVCQVCEEAQLLAGARRMVENLPETLKRDKAQFITYRGEELADFLRENPRYKKVVVLLSGDVGFYSGAKKMLEIFRQEELAKKYKIRLMCGISSAVYFASRLQLPWEDMKLMSLHGRNQNLPGVLRTHSKVFTLTDGAEGICRLSRELLAYGFEQTQMYIGRQLGGSEEEIRRGTPGDFTRCSKEGLYVVLLLNPKAEHACVTHGMKDEAFIRSKVPMTKEEVRSISLSKLQLCRNSVVYDIGAGTGSISVECSRIVPQGMVYAIEKQPEAAALTEQNKYAWQAKNLELVRGMAPKALEGLPAPTHAFIGGSGGKLEEIMEVLWRKNPKVRVVINAIALETLSEIVRLIKKYKLRQQEIVQINVSKAKELGNYQMMKGQNPVYVVTLQQ